MQFTAKEEASLAAIKLNVKVFKVGDWVREKLMISDMDISFKNITNYSEDLLENNCLAPIQSMLSGIKGESVCVIDSLKSRQQLGFLKSNDVDIRVVSFHCPKKIRFERLYMRSRHGDPNGEDEFNARDAFELKGGLRYLLLNSDFQIFSKCQQCSAEKFSKYLKLFL